MSYRRNDDAKKRNITQTYMDSLDAWENTVNISNNHELQLLQKQIDIEDMNKLRNLKRELDVTKWMFDKNCGKNCSTNPTVIHGIGGNCV